MFWHQRRVWVVAVASELAVFAKAHAVRECATVSSPLSHSLLEPGSLWTLYNGVTENLKGGDLSKLPQRTMTMQSVFDKIANHAPVIVEAEEVALPA